MSSNDPVSASEVASEAPMGAPPEPPGEVAPGEGDEHPSSSFVDDDDAIERHE